jgi:hypothetical protein
VGISGPSEISVGTGADKHLNRKKIHDLGAQSISYHGLKAAVEQAATENRK